MRAPRCCPGPATVGEVWIAADDTVDEGGELVRSPATIRFCEPPAEGLSAAAARELAAAADLLDS